MGKTFQTGGLTNVIFYDTSGNVAINDTTASGYRLKVNGTLGVSGAATFSSSVTTGSFTNSTYFKVANSNGISGYLIPQATWLGTGTATNLLIAAETGNSIGFMTNGTTDFRMFINTSGNVGIGTTSPAVKLDILTTTSSSADATGIRLLNNNGENVGNIDFDNIFGNLARITGTKMAGGALADDGMIVFSTAVNSALSERMRIRNNGSIVLNSNDFGTVYNFSFKGVTGLDCFAALSVRNNGDNIINFFNGSSGYVASISVNSSSVSYGTGSDYRLKEDLKDFNGLALIDSIKMYDFQFKRDSSRMYGALAHELQKVIPYAVTGQKDEVDADGNPKIQNVDYSKIVPVLVKAIQELSAKVTALENK